MSCGDVRTVGVCGYENPTRVNYTPTIWSDLAESELRLIREKERLDEFSDASSPVLKEVQRKLATVHNAMKYISENGLEPGIVEKEEAEPGADTRKAGIFNRTGIGK